MIQQSRRQVSVRSADWQKASRLRDEVSRVSGCKVTITETISRALGCLEDELTQPRPQQGVEVSKERLQRENLRMEVVSLLSQFIARTMPERRLRGVAFDSDEGPGGVVTLFVHLDDLKIPLFVGRVPRLVSGAECRVDSEPVTWNE